MEFGEGVAVLSKKRIIREDLRWGTFTDRKESFRREEEKRLHEVRPQYSDIELIESRSRAALESYKKLRNLLFSGSGEVFLECSSIGEALARTRELIGIIPNNTEKSLFKGKFGPELFGLAVGFSAVVNTGRSREIRSFRFDSDPENGSHINVILCPEAKGKNDPDSLNIAFSFPGKFDSKIKEAIPRQVELTGTYHGYKQSKV